MHLNTRSDTLRADHFVSVRAHVNTGSEQGHCNSFLHQCALLLHISRQDTEFLLEIVELYQLLNVVPFPFRDSVWRSDENVTAIFLFLLFCQVFFW